jgi:membrane associated rhomboid family serine protease
MFHVRLQGGFRDKVISRTSVLGRIHLQTRFYARARTPVRHRPDKTKSETSTWIDPFKESEFPRPDYRTLIRPALFTMVVVVSGDFVADWFVDQRTSQATTRAERKQETAWTIYPIIGINVAVFLLWRTFPSLLYKFGGITTPYAPTAAQLIGNTFSHQDVYHLFFNQVAFYALGSLVCDTLGREHFLSLYISAACVSTLTSVAATQYLVAKGFYSPEYLVRGSLGASGIIYTMLAISALTYPDLQVGAVLIPIYFPLKYVFPAFCTFDLIGIISKWTRYDHVCHVCILVLELR